MASYQQAFLDSVERYITRSKLTPTEFGKQAANDPKLVFELRAGRSVGVKLMDRVQTWMMANPPQRIAAERATAADKPRARAS